MDDETLVGITARRVVFSHDGQPKAWPAGTEVYARVRRDGLIRIRVPGTLFTQDVSADAIDIP
jgi:hypothetical protein